MLHAAAITAGAIDFDAVRKHKKVLAPECGGDGHKVRGAQGFDCASVNQPHATFGAHRSSDEMLFYCGCGLTPGRSISASSIR